MSKLKILLLFSCFSTLFSPYTLSQEFDSVYLENLAKTYLEQQLTVPKQGKLQIEISTIDPRIVIKPCDQPLKITPPKTYKSRNINIKISCESIESWRVFVTAKISKVVPVVVAQRYIAKGSPLSGENLTVILKETYTIRSEYFTTLTELMSVKATRSISKGKTITRKNICLVCKGEQVIIKASANNFNIQTSGIALMNGIKNQTIKVKNSRSGRVISAKIKTSTQVEINL
ncbi:MAG: flagellar basal body P-ring formation protein FlgA [Alteromonadaceae bacterium]|nr:flagellar basal body P-ring formation protein FlgA [Alteromonadaceae bacterium]